MANEKQIKSRFQQKHDIEVNWNLAENFIPKAGEIVIYDPDTNYNYPRIKIGNGTTPVGQLKFINEIDKTLSISEALADAKVVGDSISQLSNLIGDTSVANQIESAVAQKTQVQIITWEDND